MLFFAITDQWMNGDKATFLTGRNLTTISSQTATVAVAALGMTVIIIAGGIDLSAGTAIALCATVLAWNASVSGRYGKLPLIAHHYAGQGKVVLVDPTDTYRITQSLPFSHRG